MTAEVKEIVIYAHLLAAPLAKRYDRSLHLRTRSLISCCEWTQVLEQARHPLALGSGRHHLLRHSSITGGQLSFS